MKASIKQISQITGFSPATVSNALHRKKGVNQETSRLIFKTAGDLGYQIDKPVTTVKFITYRKNGRIIDDCMIFSDMIEGVERQAKKMGYETTFSHLNYGEDSFQAGLKDILEDTGSLVILLGTEMMEEDYDPFLNYQGHLVILDGWCNRMAFDGVLINNTDAACNAVEYLYQKGHREIGYLRGDYRIHGFQNREYGYYRALERKHCPLHREHIVTVGTQLNTAYEDMKTYLAGNPKLATAYFADNDVIALGVIKAMEERGLRVPEDVSIVGFDDIRYGALSTPSLTTVKIFRQEMGEAAVRRALEQVQETDRPIKIKIQIGTRFLERDSVRTIDRQ